MTRLTTLACGVALAASATLGAQSNGSSATTIEIKNGKHVKVTGCVEAGADGGYVLRNVADRKRTMHRYILVPSDSEDFSKMLNHRVKIEGKVGDRSHGRIEITTDGAKVEDSGPYLAVDHMTMIASSCG